MRGGYEQTVTLHINESLNFTFSNFAYETEHFLLTN